MRILCALLLCTGALFAQDQPQPSGKFYGPLGNNSWKFNPPANPQKVLPRQLLLRAAPNAAGLQCAVPLVEMKIPSRTDFVIGTTTPPKDLAASGWEAKNAIPPCPQR
jgi:hypothetical protein